MNKNKAKHKDDILKALNESVKFHVQDEMLAKAVNLDVFDIAYLLEELEKEGLVELLEISTKDTYRKAYMAGVLNKGKYFLKYDGFNKQYKTYLRNKIWQIVKIIAAVLNAVAIIIIAAWQLFHLIHNS